MARRASRGKPSPRARPMRRSSPHRTGSGGEIERETGAELFTRCGTLVMGPEATGLGGMKSDFVHRTLQVAERAGIAHEALGGRQIAARFPFMVDTDGTIGCFEPGGGYLRPERCIAEQLARARRRNARAGKRTRSSPALRRTAVTSFCAPIVANGARRPRSWPRGPGPQDCSGLRSSVSSRSGVRSCTGFLWAPTHRSRRAIRSISEYMGPARAITSTAFRRFPASDASRSRPSRRNGQPVPTRLGIGSIRPSPG